MVLCIIYYLWVCLCYHWFYKFYKTDIGLSLLKLQSLEGNGRSLCYATTDDVLYQLLGFFILFKGVANFE